MFIILKYYFYNDYFREFKFLCFVILIFSVYMWGGGGGIIYFMLMFIILGNRKGIFLYFSINLIYLFKCGYFWVFL